MRLRLFVSILGLLAALCTTYGDKVFALDTPFVDNSPTATPTGLGSNGQFNVQSEGGEDKGSAAAGEDAGEGAGGDTKAGGIQLLVPIGGMTSVNSSGFRAFYDYFGGIWPWILSVTVGIAVLNALIGGIMIMIAGDNSGMRSEGIQKVEYSILGLVVIALAGTILRIINPMFYN